MLNSKNIYVLTLFLFLSIIFFFGCPNMPEEFTPIVVPMLNSPTDGATDLPVPTTLTWQPVAGTDSYGLQVSQVNTFSSFIFNQNGLTTTSKQITAITNQATYYWRVNSTNKLGTSDWSNVWSFTTVASLPIPTNGLIAYFPFNGNAIDESGNENNGTVYGATLTTDRFGSENKAYYFDGVDDYIHIGKTSFPPPFSIVAWIYKTGEKSTQTLLGSDYYIKIEQYNNTHKVGFTKKLVGDYTFNYEIPVNKWQCVVWIFDNDAKLFVDGEYKGSNGHTIYCPMTSISSGANIILGKVDDIRIYNHVLTETEIQALFHEGGW